MGAGAWVGDPAADLMRKVAGLAAVAAVLAGYLLFGDRPPGAGEGGSVRHARLVDAFDRAAVRRITISRAGAAPFSLVRQPPGKEPAWRESPGGEAGGRRRRRGSLERDRSGRDDANGGRRARRRRVDAAPGGARARRAARPGQDRARASRRRGAGGVRARRRRDGDRRGAAEGGRARRSRRLGVSRSASGPAVRRRDRGDQLARGSARRRRPEGAPAASRRGPVAERGQSVGRRRAGGREPAPPARPSGRAVRTSATRARGAVMDRGRDNRWRDDSSVDSGRPLRRPARGSRRTRRALRRGGGLPGAGGARSSCGARWRRRRCPICASSRRPPIR